MAIIRGSYPKKGGGSNLWHAMFLFFQRKNNWQNENGTLSAIRFKKGLLFVVV